MLLRSVLLLLALVQSGSALKWGPPVSLPKALARSRLALNDELHYKKSLVELGLCRELAIHPPPEQLVLQDDASIAWQEMGLCDSIALRRPSRRAFVPVETAQPPPRLHANKVSLVPDEVGAVADRVLWPRFDGIADHPRARRGHLIAARRKQ